MSKIIGRRLSIFWGKLIIVIEKRPTRQVEAKVTEKNPLHLENIIEHWDGSESCESIGSPMVNSYGQSIESYLTGDEYWQTEDEYRLDTLRPEGTEILGSTIRFAPAGFHQLK